MNFLFDIGHPAHVHLFKHGMRKLIGERHNVTIVARAKDVTTDLLSSEGFEFAVLSRARTTRLGMLIELIQRDLRIFRLMRRRKVAVAIGTSASISRVSRLLGARAVIFGADDSDIVPLFSLLAYPLAHAICTPEGVRTGRWSRKQITYPGYHELAYLHPDLFSPDPSFLSQLGLSPIESFSLVRLSGFAAHHDVGEKGLTKDQVRRLIDLLETFGRVFVNAEGQLPDWAEAYRLPLPPERIHDALAHASCLVSDSQTMTREAAVLGVPSFRCNSFVGRLSVLEELEHKYGLTLGFTPDRYEDLLRTVKTLLQSASLKEEWREKQRRMLADKVNVADWMFDYLISLQDDSRRPDSHPSQTRVAASNE